MKKGRAVVTTTGMEKAVETPVINAVILKQTEKRTNYQMVAVGVCPHDDSELLTPTRTTGTGEKAVCTQCGHTWYVNRKIRTCKCLTCSADKRPQARELTEPSGTRNFRQNSGGPFWARTRDLSLIRTAL